MSDSKKDDARTWLEMHHDMMVRLAEIERKRIAIEAEGHMAMEDLFSLLEEMPEKVERETGLDRGHMAVLHAEYTEEWRKEQKMHRTFYKQILNKALPMVN